ncbi:unnamed protein product [Rotaria sordida]|uniref:Uncharacterized protein n=1 Tax=Rotaria sordida TaxID=392033 RepID=A0A819CD76_9BILA|nr:unnamed protein product [Rotaria sordida]CAF3817696.1 unnamed protein product [Rotaria sordida]
MFPKATYNPMSMGFQYPGQQHHQQQSPSIYQSQYNGFNRQMQVPFQQAPLPPGQSLPRGQSLPASMRQHPPSNRQNPPPNRQNPPSNRQNPPPNSIYPPNLSQRYEQYEPSAVIQQYDYRHNYVPQGKRHHKHRNISSNGVTDQDLQPDREKSTKKKSKESHQNQSPALENHIKQDETTINDHQEEQSLPIENIPNVNQSEDHGVGVEQQQPQQQQQNSEEKKNRKSRSKKKNHHRHDHVETNNHDDNTYFQTQPSAFFAELPSHVKVHQQPLYTSYNQVYEESILRGDLYQKQAKRSTRLPPEAKQKLLPHEEDKKKPYPVVGYFQQQQQQQYNDARPPFSPYQPYTARPHFYGPTVPYNPRQAWSNINGNNMVDEQKIDRLRNHIQALEHELHKLQKKLYKATLHRNEVAIRGESHRIQHRSKREAIGSPRQTPVIVELNSTINDNVKEPSTTSSKIHRNRTESDHSSQQGQNHVQHTNEISEQNVTSFDNHVRSQSPDQYQIDSHERTYLNDNQILESEEKISLPKKSSREETAAQLAHAAAAHVNARQQFPPPPPPSSSQPKILHQTDVLPAQEQQIRGQIQCLPVNGNIHHSNDLQQQRNVANLNNNEFHINKDEPRNFESVEKILDAFERIYMKDRKTATTPVKVKYIPDEQHSICYHQRNKNNNNQYRSASPSSQTTTSSSSTWSNTSDEPSLGGLPQKMVIIE